MNVKQALPALTSLAALALAPAGASAATYDVNTCNAAAGGSVLAMTQVNSSAGKVTTNVNCPASTTNHRTGLGIFDTLNQAGGTPVGTRVEWRATAPAGLTISRVSVRRYMGSRSMSWRPYVSVDDQIAAGQTCTIGESQVSCAVGSSDPQHAENNASLTNLNASSWAIGVVCGTDVATCPNSTTPNFERVYAYLYSATTTINDPEAPAVSAITGDITAGGWLSGPKQVTFSATDSSGIQSTSLLVDGGAIAAAPATCDYTRMRPCENATRQVTLDVASLGEGAHTVTAQATDAAGQVSSGPALPVLVDTKAPSAPAPLEATRQSDGRYTLTWTNPDQGGASPISTAHYRICQPGSTTACPASGTQSAADIHALNDVPFPAGGGPWTIYVSLQDQAGHHDPSQARALTVQTSPASLGPGTDPGTPGASPRPDETTSLSPQRGARLTSARLRSGALRLSGSAHPASGKLTVTLARRAGRGAARRKTIVYAKGTWATNVVLPKSWGKPASVYVTIMLPATKTRAAVRTRGTLTRKTGSSTFAVKRVLPGS